MVGCDRCCSSAGNIRPAALGTDRGMELHRLGDDPTPFHLSLQPLMGDVFAFMGGDSHPGLLGRDVGRRFKGNPRIIGAVAVFSRLTGLAFLWADILFNAPRRRLMEGVGGRRDRIGR